MEDDVYTLSEDKGKPLALGLISAFCHGYTIEQAAALNAIDDVDSARVIMMMLMSDAGLIPTITDDLFEEEE